MGTLKPKAKPKVKARSKAKSKGSKGTSRNKKKRSALQKTKKFLGSAAKAGLGIVGANLLSSLGGEGSETGPEVDNSPAGSSSGDLASLGTLENNIDPKKIDTEAQQAALAKANAEIEGASREVDLMEQVLQASKEFDDRTSKILSEYGLGSSKVREAQRELSIPSTSAPRDLLTKSDISRSYESKTGDQSLSRVIVMLGANNELLGQVHSNIGLLLRQATIPAQAKLQGLKVMKSLIAAQNVRDNSMNADLKRKQSGASQPIAVTPAYVEKQVSDLQRATRASNGLSLGSLLGIGIPIIAALASDWISDLIGGDASDGVKSDVADSMKSEMWSDIRKNAAIMVGQDLLMEGLESRTKKSVRKSSTKAATKAETRAVQRTTQSVFTKPFKGAREKVAARRAEKIVEGDGVEAAVKKASRVIGKRAANKFFATLTGKMLSKSTLKKIPIVGTLMGAYYAVDRLIKGDSLASAGAELTSGIVGGLGSLSGIVSAGAGSVAAWVASAGIDVGLMIRDAIKCFEYIEAGDIKGLRSLGWDTDEIASMAMESTKDSLLYKKFHEKYPTAQKLRDDIFQDKKHWYQSSASDQAATEAAMKDIYFAAMDIDSPLASSILKMYDSVAGFRRLGFSVREIVELIHSPRPDGKAWNVRYILNNIDYLRIANGELIHGRDAKEGKDYSYGYNNSPFYWVPPINLLDYNYINGIKGDWKDKPFRVKGIDEPLFTVPAVFDRLHSWNKLSRSLERKKNSNSVYRNARNSTSEAAYRSVNPHSPNYLNESEQIAQWREKAEAAGVRFQYEKGGVIQGPSHAEGGVPVGDSNIEVEGGEYIVNKRTTAKHKELLDDLNKGTLKVQDKTSPTATASPGGETINTGSEKITIQNGGLNIAVMELAKAVKSLRIDLSHHYSSQRISRAALRGQRKVAKADFQSSGGQAFEATDEEGLQSSGPKSEPPSTTSSPAINVSNLGIQGDIKDGDGSKAAEYFQRLVMGVNNTYTSAGTDVNGRSNHTDCGGSIQRTYKDVYGMNIPIGPLGQWTNPIGKVIDVGQVNPDGSKNTGPSEPNLSVLKPGDLLFYSSTREGTVGRPYRIGHVEMYLGNGKMGGTGASGIRHPKDAIGYSSRSSGKNTVMYIGAKRLVGDEIAEANPSESVNNFTGPQIAPFSASWSSNPSQLFSMFPEFTETDSEGEHSAGISQAGQSPLVLQDNRTARNYDNRRYNHTTTTNIRTNPAKQGEVS